MKDYFKRKAHDINCKSYKVSWLATHDLCKHTDTCELPHKYVLYPYRPACDWRGHVDIEEHRGTAQSD